MPHHKLSLCADHYPGWILKHTKRFIRKYGMFTPEERILVAISGGKDSLALWDVLLQLGYQADGLYIHLGIDGGLAYSDASEARARAFAARYPQTQLHVVNVAEAYGAGIPQVTERSGGHSRPCSLCGRIKRHEMNRIALEGGYTVLATGHNLDDEAALLFGNVLHWKTGYLLRQGPVLPATEGMARKVKPFCRFYERETAAYALLQGIDYVWEECPFAAGATTLTHKETLLRMEHAAPGTKLQFYLSFLHAKEEGFFRATEKAAPPLHACEHCGQPTTASDLCAFCRIWERLAEEKGKERELSSEG